MSIKRKIFTLVEGATHVDMSNSTCKKCFTLAEGATHVDMSNGYRKAAFTLAEVLITLGIIGVVAAITLPGLITNITDKIRTEKVRMVKYKLTNATSEMNTQGLIYGYSSTSEFVDELSKYFKILSRCDSSNLSKCWGYNTINLPGESNEIKTIDVDEITNGAKLNALALSTNNTLTEGIITGDGTPMIMVFSPTCDIPEDNAHQSWSTVNGKPETNSTTNCISAIFDINGPNPPNTIGKDIRTLNSIFGFRKYSATRLSRDDCRKYLSKYNLDSVCNKPDYWAGAKKRCLDAGLNLPSEQTLANIANSIYGRTDIGSNTYLMTNDYTSEYLYPGIAIGDCPAVASTRKNIICVSETNNLYKNQDLSNKLGGWVYWSDDGRTRTFHPQFTGPRSYGDGNALPAICVAD